MELLLILLALMYPNLALIIFIYFVYKLFVEKWNSD